MVWEDFIQACWAREDSDHQGKQSSLSWDWELSTTKNIIMVYYSSHRGRRGRGRRVVNYRDLDAPEETY